MLSEAPLRLRLPPSRQKEKTKKTGKTEKEKRKGERGFGRWEERSGAERNTFDFRFLLPPPPHPHLPCTPPTRPSSSKGYWPIFANPILSTIICLWSGHFLANLGDSILIVGQYFFWPILFWSILWPMKCLRVLCVCVCGQLPCAGPHTSVPMRRPTRTFEGCGASINTKIPR